MGSEAGSSLTLYITNTKAKKMLIINNKTIIGILFLLISFGVVGQEKNSEDNSPVNILKGDNANFNLLNSGLVLPSFSKKENMVQSSGNQVFIQQIGQGNYIISDINSSDAEVELNQNGNDNNIQVSLRAQKIRERISQSGDGNTASRYVNDTDAVINLELSQNGNNSFEQYGVNSKTENLKITQQAGARAVIVRSFK